MPYSTWVDDHSNTYSTPYIPNKIVGFHGIDPDLVGSGGSGSGGGIDDHEQLNNLLGGDNVNGHWHMTKGEYMTLRELLSVPPCSLHEHLPDLLGGDESGHYHVNADEYNVIQHLACPPGIPSNEFIFLTTELLKKIFPRDSNNDLLPLTGNELNDFIDARINAALTARGL